MRHLPILCTGGLVLLLFFSSSALAQRNPTSVIAQGASYHVFAQPGEATIEVLVLGAAPAGIYVLGASTSLTKFFALMGGLDEGRISETTVTETTVRLLREEGGQRVVVYEAKEEEIIRNPNAYPQLQDGDVFFIETEVSRRFSLRETLSIVSSISSLTLLVIRVIDFASN